MPLDFMLQVMRDADSDLVHRLDMAKAAAPYLHAKLSTIEIGNKGDEKFRHVFEWQSN